MIYANKGLVGGYTTSTCSRTVELSRVRNDIEILNENVPCEASGSNKITYYPSNDPVCGCDGNTYRNAYAARKRGIQTWEIGTCEEAAKD